MQHLMPRPRRRSSVSVRARKMIATAWMIASLALPVAGVVAITQGVANLAPGDPTFHTVQAGETLTGIALRYGVSVDEIVQANGLSNANYLYVGQQLAIPNDVPSGGQIHTVQVGESLSVIARRYGVTVDAVVNANGLTNRNSIIAGQKLTIPGGTVEQLANEPSLTYT